MSATETHGLAPLSRRQFLKMLAAGALLAPLAAVRAADARKPNIIIILTDDMGFSDLGCYGGEVNTPNIDKMADGGVKFSQFYNGGKCEPSRAALTTGHHWWTHSPNVAVRKESPNIGEVIRSAGYRTMMVGKWHCEGVPFERGFDRHFGFMGGGTDYLLGDESFTLDGKPWKVQQNGFYATTALTDYAVRFIREENRAHPQQPFFLYLAYNAPHAPIEARSEDVAKYRGKYLKGWDTIRKERFERQKALGLAGPGWHLPERPAGIPAWETLSDKEKDFQDLRMATYAAMVDCMDQGVGAVMRTLDELGIRDNTLVLFLNDNGASPNDRVRGKEFGSPGSTWQMGVAWAFVSNTPLKYYKRTQHSGGVTTPCIASWPAVIRPRKEFEDQPCHITDILPTLIELTGGSYPVQFGGKEQPPLPGRSFAAILKNNEVLPQRTLYFSLFNNMAIVDHGWRLVTAYGQPWQLYDLSNDRTETHDLAMTHPEKLKEMLALQRAFFERPDVRLRLQSGEREPAFAPVFKADGSKGPGAKEDVEDPEFSLLLAKARAEGRQLSASELETLRKSPTGPQPAPGKRKNKARAKGP